MNLSSGMDRQNSDIYTLTFMIYVVTYVYDVACHKHTFSRSIDLERSHLKHRPNERSEQEQTLVSIGRFISLRVSLSACRSIRIRESNFHTFQKASAEPPLEWSKWAAIREMAIFA